MGSVAVSNRVGLIGHGAINSVVAAALVAGEVPDTSLTGVLTRSGDAPGAVEDLSSLVQASDVIVEAASQQAVRDHAESVLVAGRDLVVTSVGALVDDVLLNRVKRAAEGPNGGRLLLCAGAVGGLELLRAVRRAGPMEQVSLTSTKNPMALREPAWMDAETLARLEGGEDHFKVFAGSAREAASLFPRSLNIAATLALTTTGMDKTRVVLVADPDVNLTTHQIDVVAAMGTYRFTITNAPSPTNPRTSGLTPHAVLRLLEDRIAPVLAGA